MVINDLVSSIPIVVGKIAASTSPRTLVLVAGGSCSGKSHFSRQLQAALAEAGITAALVEQDSYFRDFNDPQIPRDSKSRIIFDHPNSYHNYQLRADIFSLLAGRSVSLPIYDVNTNTRSPGRKLQEPCQVVIVDGLFAISQADILYEDKVRIFIDASSEVRMDRRIARDILYGASKSQIRSAFLERVEPYYKQFVSLQTASADIIVKNDWR